MKKKILFVNDEMTMGGVARILIGLLNKIDMDQYDVDVLILHPHGELMDELPRGVRLIKSHPFFNAVDTNIGELVRSKQLIKIIHKLILVLLMKTGMIVPVIKSIRKNLLQHKYDVEFSAKEGFCTIFVSCGDAKKKLNWVQVDYSVQNYSKNHMGLMIKALKNIDLNIACSEKVGKAYGEMFKTNRIQVINNFIDTETVEQKLKETVDVTKYPEFTFITVARFHPQKSVDRLIQAFAFVHKQNPNSRLVVIGDGEQKKMILDLIESNQIQDHVVLLGIKHNPYPYIKEADVFVLSSLYEGFPTIVVESLLSGTPVLATDVAGVKEQILRTEHGWIVENSQEALQKKMLDVSLEHELISAFKLKLVTYSYPNETILQSYYEIFS